MDSMAEADDDLDLELLRALEEDSGEEAADVGAQPKEKRQRVDTAQSTVAAAEHRKEALVTGLFASISSEVILQVLAHVSAEDLTAIARTCNFFRHASGENNLWRPLYAARWGGLREEDARKLQDSVSWKEKYMERDHIDVQDVKDKVPGFMQTYYLQMATAKRSQAVSPGRKPPPLSDTALRGRVSKWRDARGFDGRSGLGPKHAGCKARGPFSALGDSVFMCEACGWAHQCGDGCAERLVDEGSELLVCPISGRCFTRMLAEWEEDSGQEAEAGVLDFGVAGVWGRAYAEGYNCTSEELQSRYGIALS